MRGSFGSSRTIAIESLGAGRLDVSLLLGIDCLFSFPCSDTATMFRYSSDVDMDIVYEPEVENMEARGLVPERRTRECGAVPRRHLSCRNVFRVSTARYRKRIEVCLGLVPPELRVLCDTQDTRRHSGVVLKMEQRLGKAKTALSIDAFLVGVVPWMLYLQSTRRSITTIEKKSKSRWSLVANM